MGYYVNKRAGTIDEFSEPVAAASRFKNKSLRRFTPPLTSGRTDLTQASRDLVNARADYLARNDSVGAAISGRLCDYVIGNGLRVKSCIDWKRAGITREHALELQEMFEADFDEWASSKESDYFREQSFYSAQYLAYFQSFLKGELFFVIPHDEGAENFDEIDVSLRHQLIDPDRVSSPSMMADRWDLVSGIKLDKKGRSLGYHITEKHPADFTDPQGARHWEFYPAYRDGRRYLHHNLRRKKKPDALRGLSIFAAVIDRIFDLRRYREAEIRTAIKQSNLIMALFSRDEHSILGDLKEEKGLYLEEGEVGGLEHSTLLDLGDEDRLETPESTHPSSGYVPFTQEAKKEIAATIGIPHQVMEMLFDASFSASRAAIMQCTDFCDIERGEFAPAYCTPHYHRFIDEKVALGDYDIPNYEDRRVRNAIKKARWEGKLIGAIDEQKQAQAAKTRTGAKITSKREERERMGLNHELMEQQIAQEEDAVRKSRERRRNNEASVAS